MTGEVCGCPIKKHDGVGTITSCVRPTNHQGRCRDAKYYEQNRAWHKANPPSEVKRARDRVVLAERWCNDPLYREIHRQRKRSEPYKATRKQYRQREDVRDKERAYRVEREARPEVREHIREWARDYYQRKPDGYKLQANLRRVRLQGVPHEDWTQEQVIALYGEHCYLCGTGPYEQTEHVVPISRGGWDVLANLRPACGPCNRRKHNKIYWNATLIEVCKALPEMEIDLD